LLVLLWRIRFFVFFKVKRRIHLIYATLSLILNALIFAILPYRFQILYLYPFHPLRIQFRTPILLLKTATMHTYQFFRRELRYLLRWVLKLNRIFRMVVQVGLDSILLFILLETHWLILRLGLNLESLPLLFNWCFLLT
jgi:hypothetical protein